MSQAHHTQRTERSMSKTLGAVLVLVWGGWLSACGGEAPDDTSSEPGAGAATPDDSNTSIDDVGIGSNAEVRAGNWETGYHFVQISTHGAPRWSGYVDEIRDDNGAVINSHSMGTRSGGKVNFWYWAYPGTHYHVHIWALSGVLGHSFDAYPYPTTLDRCYQVSALGSISDKGSSLSGCDSH
jgi:hypothetical protein